MCVRALMRLAALGRVCELVCVCAGILGEGRNSEEGGSSSQPPITSVFLQVSPLLCSRILLCP